MKSPSSLEFLTEALCRLPGVGPKSAQRIAYHLMQHDRDGAALLARALAQAVEKIRHCSKCNTLTENELCDTCLDPKRDATLLCVVETPGGLIVGDVIWRTCGRCGFYWYEKPLDGDTTQVVTKPDPILEGN